MKRLLCLILCLPLALCLTSCQYDKTHQIRQWWTGEHSYTLRLRLDGVEHGCRLTLFNQPQATLLFTDGPLQGMEKQFSPQGEADVYDGMRFELPFPSAFFALWESVQFLAQQQYLLSKNTKPTVSFVFEEDRRRLELICTADPLAPQRLTLSADGQRLEAEFSNDKES